MGTTITRVGAAAAVLLAFGLAACGDDDGEDEGAGDGGADEGAGASTEAFCGALVDFNSAVLAVELDETSAEADAVAAGEQLSPLTETMAENAPDSVADGAAEIDGVVQALLDGDAEAFSADSTFETYVEFLDGSIGECGFEQVEVSMIDYGFEGLSESMSPGTVAFALTNDTEAGEDHEMVVLRKAEGVTQSFQELLELPEEEAMTMVDFLGAGFAPPGESGSVLVDLTPGEYAAICFIPVGGGEDGPPHFTQGMFQEFTVG
jgi:hypothetical protein